MNHLSAALKVLRPPNLIPNSTGEVDLEEKKKALIVAKALIEFEELKHEFIFVTTNPKITQEEALINALHRALVPLPLFNEDIYNLARYPETFKRLYEINTDIQCAMTIANNNNVCVLPIMLGDEQTLNFLLDLSENFKYFKNLEFPTILLVNSIINKNGKIALNLIKRGANLNYIDSKTGNNIIQIAIEAFAGERIVEFNYFNFIESLISLGLDLYNINFFGQRPIDIAREKNDELLIKLLEKYEGYFNLKYFSLSVKNFLNYYSHPLHADGSLKVSNFPILINNSSSVIINFEEFLCKKKSRLTKEKYPKPLAEITSNIYKFLELNPWILYEDEQEKIKRQEQLKTIEVTVAEILEIARFSDWLQKVLEYQPESINKVDVDGKSPLMLALIQDNFKTARNLVRAGADIFKKDKHGISAFIYAVYSNNLDSVKLFLESEIKINIEDTNIQEANLLCKATECGNLEMVEYLIAKGISVDEISKFGETPIHIAVEKYLAAAEKHIKLRRLEKSKCYTFNRKLNRSEFNESLYFKHEHNEFLRYLNIIESFLKAGMNKSIRSKKGKLPIDIAREFAFNFVEPEYLDLVRILTENSY